MSIIPKAILIAIPIVALAAWAAWRPGKTHPDNPVRMRGFFRFVNAVGRAYEEVFHRPLLRLDPKRFEAELVAIKKAEYELYGSPDGPSELNGLGALLRGFGSPRALPSTLGRIRIMGRIRQNLRHRQQVLAYVRSHPQVLEVPICRPLIITGLPRTGTTFLQRLMATDPRVRSPHVWVMVSDPSPRPPTKDEIINLSDPRLRAIQMRFQRTSLVSPDRDVLRRMSHAAKPTDVDEESDLMMHCMWNNAGATVVGEDDSYEQWVFNKDEDKTYMYKYVKVWLQIQSSTYAPESHWVLKTPAHSYFLPTLAQEFPDANLVFIHRDPCSVIPSTCRFIKVTPILIMDFEKYDPHWHGERVLNVLKKASDRIVRFKNSDSEISKRALHILYEDLVADPIGTAERIYAHFGYQMTDEFRVNMSEYLVGNPQHKHGKPSYSLEEFGLDEATVQKAFADYIQTFRRQGEV